MPFRHPHSVQRRPAGAHAVRPVLGPHARTDRTKETRVAEPRLPSPEDGRPGEGQRLTPDAPHNGGRPPPPGDAPPPPLRHAAPTGHASRGDSAGPPHPHTRAHSTWVADPDSPPRGRAVGGGGAPDLRSPSQRRKAPSPGYALPPTPQRATPARKGARCGAGAGSPRPHRPHPGHTGRGTQAARTRARAAGGGTAPDTRRLSQRWQATPPGDGPQPPPRHAAPTGHASRGDSAGSPHPHTRAHSTWVADPDSPPRGRAVGGGGAPDPRCPSQRRKAPSPGYALPRPAQRATRARKGARSGAGAGSPRPHQPQPGHRGCGTPAARPRGRAAGGGTAPDTGRPSQQWQGTTPGEGPPPPPRHAAPTGHASQEDSAGPPHPHARAHSMWVTDPDSPPRGGAVGGGGAPDLRRPSQRRTAPPPGTPFRHPHSEQRRPARAHAAGPVLGPRAGTDRARDTRVAEPRLPAPEDGRPGEGQRLTPDAPHNGGRPPPPGTAPHHPRGTQLPQGMQAEGTVPGAHTRTPAPTARGGRTPTARPEGGQSGEGERLTPDAPHNGERRSPQVTPFRRSNSVQCGPARAHAVGPVLDPHARTDRTRDTRVAESRLPAPEDGRQGEGQRLTPDAPHNGGRPPPLGTAPHHPRHAAPTEHASQGDSAGPPHPHTCAHSTWVADPDSQPRGRAVGGGGAPDPRRPSQRRKALSPGYAFPPPPQRAMRARKGARSGAGAGSPRPHQPHPEHTGRGILAVRPRGRAAGGGTAPDTRRSSQRWQATPPGIGPPPPATRSPDRACKPRGQCWAPTPTQPRPQHVGGGPRQPAQWAGSRGRGSA